MLPEHKVCVANCRVYGDLCARPAMFMVVVGWQADSRPTADGT